MEGFLYEKRSRDSSKSLFGSGKVFKKRWCTLQGQVLAVYDDIDIKKQKPKGPAKSHIKVAGKLARPKENQEDGQQHVFEVIPQNLTAGTSLDSNDNKEIFILGAESADMMAAWIQTINEASIGDSLILTLAQHCQILGLPPPEERPVHESEVTHAYRRAVSKCHPDKPGGDERNFRLVQKAYEALLRHIIRADDFQKIVFTVVLEKTATAGIGLRVVEDDETGEIVVRGIHPKIVIHQLGDAAGGSLLDGDILSGIGEESTLAWKFSRIRQRLNDFREPVGSFILLQFVRYVPIPGKGGDVAQSAGDFETQVKLPEPGTSAAADSALTAGASINSANIEVIGGVTSPTTPITGRSSVLVVPSAAGARSISPQPRSILKNKLSPPMLPAAAGSSISPQSPTGLELTLSPISPHANTSATGNMLLSLQQENAELRKSLFASQEALAAETKKLKQQSDTNVRLTEELKVQAAALQVSQSREYYANLQLQDLLITAYHDTAQNPARSQTSENWQKNIAHESEKLVSGRTLYASEQTEAYLKKADLSLAKTEPQTYKQAQCLAVMSISAFDPSAAILDLWDASGISAEERLLRLEQRIQKTEQNLGFAKVVDGFILPDPKKKVPTVPLNGEPVDNAGGTSPSASRAGAPRSSIFQNQNLFQTTMSAADADANVGVIASSRRSMSPAIAAVGSTANAGTSPSPRMSMSPTSTPAALAPRASVAMGFMHHSVGAPTAATAVVATRRLTRAS